MIESEAHQIERSSDCFKAEAGHGIGGVSKEKKICFIASIPITILYFYGKLLKCLQTSGWSPCVIASDAPELSRIQKTYQLRTLPVAITRNINPLKDLWAVFRIILFFRKHRYEIVHAHTPKGGLIGMLASYCARVPVRIYTIHGLPLETASGIKRKLLWLAEKTACMLATHILSVSPSLKARVIDEKLCKPDKISILAHGTACGIDVDRFSKNEKTEEDRVKIRGRLGIPESDIVFGFVGRITPVKGIHTLIHSFLRVAKQKQASLLLAGESDTVRESLDKEVSKFIAENHKIFAVGHQEDPVPFYAAMDIFAMPTRREGFGMTFLEANAMGLPVIGCKVTGCVDAVVNGETGLLVSVDNEEELAGAMIQLMDDKELRNRLGTAGQQRVDAYFDSALLVNEHMKLYESSLKT